MRQTFTIRFIVKDKDYKRTDYPFPNFIGLGSVLDGVLETMHDNPEEKWGEELIKWFPHLTPCKEGDKTDYTFFFDEEGCYDQDHNLIKTMKDRFELVHEERWRFHSSFKDYKEDPLGLATPESMEGDEMAKKLLKSSLEVLDLN